MKLRNRLSAAALAVAALGSFAQIASAKTTTAPHGLGAHVAHAHLGAVLTPHPKPKLR
ncbi:MAG: hypothetical protein U0Y82_15040 [Thermoleophilia bacterium]